MKVYRDLLLNMSHRPDFTGMLGRGKNAQNILTKMFFKDEWRVKSGSENVEINTDITRKPIHIERTVVIR